MTTGKEGGGIEMMADHDRAANNANYKVNKQQLIDLIENYRQRKYIEDLNYL